jgi:hypothetical protein
MGKRRSIIGLLTSPVDLVVRHTSRQAPIARQVADMLAHGPSILLRVQSKDADRPRRRVDDIEHTANGRGFARAIRTQEPKISPRSMCIEMP